MSSYQLYQNNLCFWLTGLPASGKTTLAHALADKFREHGYGVYILDGDELRSGLCSDLGLSAEDRSENIRRAGHVARLMYDAGLVVICAFVSPFVEDRRKVKQLFSRDKFVEVHVATSMEVCASRDPKGLYQKAKQGLLSGLTGWDAPYEAPLSPNYCFDETVSLGKKVDVLFHHFLRMGG